MKRLLLGSPVGLASQTSAVQSLAVRVAGSNGRPSANGAPRRRRKRRATTTATPKRRRKRRAAANGNRFTKGSAAAKRHMAKLRRMRRK